MAATVISLSVDNTILPQAVASLNWKSGYQATIPDPANPGQMIANPVTANQNAKLALIAYVRNAMADYAAMQAQTAVVAPAANLIS